MHQRPYLKTFLSLMKEKFTLVSFTASTKIYADTILDTIDPHNEYFMHRLYRQDCINLQNYFIKKLDVS